MLFLLEGISPQLAIILTIAELLVIAYALIRFIFEPRLEGFLDTRIKTLKEGLEQTLAEMEVRMSRQESDARVAALALQQVAENVKLSTKMLERVTVELTDQGKTLSYIEGELRGAALRDTRKGDQDATRRDS